ncbi:hypothetical protein [Parasitella parasitica]|uniref:Uncharacterized protein n=1 Tax=Parasitella parasitica TaxID=35722 RepID=A0A0B7NI32_9FUNG|nr:hypothetical protein [Parasitella parasitica]
MAWDPVMNKTGIWSLIADKSELDESNEEDLINFIKASKTPLDNKSEANIIDDQDTELIKDLSLRFLDQVLINIANPMEKNTDEQKKDLDWEFMLANIVQIGLPSVVVDRVQRHMTSVTGKKTPAINALNVTPCQLSDLTISDTEMEMRSVVQEMRNETEKEPYELICDDDFREDLRWLIDQSRKDKQEQQTEIEKISSISLTHI